MTDFQSHQHAPDLGGGAILDADTVETLRELGGEEDPGLFEELVELFLEDAVERVQSMLDAWDRGDLDAVTRGAHSLKSASANIGALAFSGSCKQLEAAAMAGADEHLAASVARCRGMFTELRATLQELRGPA